MAKASSRNISPLIQRRKCPCGDDQCYIRVNTEEEEEENSINNTPNNIHNNTNSSPLDPDQSAQLPTSPSAQQLYAGQTFVSAQEAQELYTNFAKQNGFAIRIQRSKGNPKHPLGVYKRELVCHRAGTHRPRKNIDPKRQRNKKSNRCDCEAGMIIKKNVSNGTARWVVVQFNNVHNHELLGTDEVRHLPAYRNISSVDRERALNLAKTGFTVKLVMRALEMEKGVPPGMLTFTERDLRNFLQASKCVNVENEGTELINVCKELKERNGEFRFEVSVGTDGKLENICFAYQDCVRAYAVFGDVVVFDTTYRLYWCDRPVAAWFGMDNYRNALCFGCALLKDDSTVSYRWALQSFVRMMEGKYPETILTDLDMSLKEAVPTELPNTKHAFGSWYVTSKLSSWFSLSLGPQFENFLQEFQRVCNLENLEEFTDQWGKMVSEFRLDSDRHVNMLAFNRDYWTVLFLRGWFLGTLTNDFHANIKSFFNGFLGSQTPLRDFVEQVGLAIERQNQTAEESTIRQNYQNATTKTCMPIEEHAKSILTPYAFNLFQKELVDSTEFAVYETHRDTYLVRHRFEPTGGCVVQCVGSDEFLRCGCKEFESSGILCRHALRVLSLKNCFSLPDQYLPARWRRENSLFPKSTGYKYRSRTLKSLVSIIIQESSMTKERFNYAQCHMNKLLSRVRDMPTLHETEFEDTLDSSQVINVRPRGRPRKSKASDNVSNGEELESDALETNRLDVHELCDKEMSENVMQHDLWETHELFGP